MNNRGGRHIGAAVTAVITTVVAVAMLSGPAQAAGQHALRASLAEPAAVAPGGVGQVAFTVQNVSDRPTRGILLNVSLPPHVTLDPDRHCQRTGRTNDGGTLISCNFSDALGQLAPGQKHEARTPFHVDKSAPHGVTLGKVGALVVPLANGKATEPWTDLTGPNTAWTSIRTS